MAPPPAADIEYFQRQPGGKHPDHLHRDVSPAVGGLSPGVGVVGVGDVGGWVVLLLPSVVLQMRCLCGQAS